MSVFGSFFGGGPRQPRTQQVVQQTKLPEEIAPYAKEVLEDAKKQYLESIEKGYDPYTGQTIAPQTQEQLDAQTGLKALVGTQRPMQEEALAQFRTGLTESFTPEVAQEYMSPYQRAVTDIEKRESQRVFESEIMPQFEKQAVQAGGMSGLGTRAGVQASELGRAQMQRLGDLEAKGLQAAYKDAQNLFQQQQARERTAAADIAGLAPAMVAGGVTEQGLLQSIGEEKQQLGQQALNEAYYKYLEAQAFPQEQLAGYSGFVYGNPLMSQRTMTTTSPAAMGPSKGSQLMGLGMTAAKMYGMGGGFGSQPGGFTMGNLGKSMFTKTGGRLSRKTGGGLSSLPVVYRQNEGKVGHSEFDAYAAFKKEDAARAEAKAKEKAAAASVSPFAEAGKLIAQQQAAALSQQSMSPKQYGAKVKEDVAKLQALIDQRGRERKTASQAYQDRMEEARKRTFEAQRGLVPTGHAGYERAMRSLLRGTAAGAPQRGLLESFLGGATEMIGGIREGETAKQKALAEIEQRRGTAEMGDIKDYHTMESADEEAAFKHDLTMIKDVYPNLWKVEQKKIDEIRESGADRATQLANITEILLDAESKRIAAQGKGLKIKAADYNAGRNMFQTMLKLGKFRGETDDKGNLTQITMIGDQSITPGQTAKLGEILDESMKIIETGGISAATTHMRKEFDRMTFPNISGPNDPRLKELASGAQFFDVPSGRLVYKR